MVDTNRSLKLYSSSREDASSETGNPTESRSPYPDYDVANEVNKSSQLRTKTPTSRRKPYTSIELATKTNQPTVYVLHLCPFWCRMDLFEIDSIMLHLVHLTPGKRMMSNPMFLSRQHVASTVADLNPTHRINFKADQLACVLHPRKTTQWTWQ